MSKTSRQPDESHRRVVFHGRVQGVGFRYTTQSLARDYTVGGYVKNLSDGTVELVVCGPSGEVNRLVEAVRSQFGSNISHVETEDLDKSEFHPEDGLSIRH